jgi:dimethylhistidine N-methyltransferase
VENPDRQDELGEIVAGLKLPRKTISPKYFYDERGSKLFERICELPEYYLTRTEIGIMRSCVDDMAGRIGRRANVIEYGIGSGLKTRILLESLDDPVAFVPIDISAEHLADACRDLSERFPHIEIIPLAADFTRAVQIPAPRRKPARNLVYFPGSTIGNFEPPAARSLLQVMHQEAGPGGALLIGVDLKKDPRLIEAAYNDSEGITAEFNLNMLRRLNRDFGSDFRLDAFGHEACYNDTSGRVEMRLVSEDDQTVSLGGQRFSFPRGEKLITEYCHKFSLGEFRALARTAGFDYVDSWTDENQWFSIQLYHR